ncbi:MAG TPA: rod shape-determining protein MreC [Bryobacteraceae bacterium]|nr:rod shape-determining protein MreC [Bryobacteraceae bacterium]
METLLARYRNVTVLALVIFAQLVLLAYQVKNDSNVRLIRIWAVTAVTPVARVIEGTRGSTDGFLQNYILLRDARSENERLRSEVGRLKLENQALKADLATADRAKALEVFEQRTPSKMIAARVIMTSIGASASAVFIDRGSISGVQKGMAVVTPDGIAGKVLAAYPTASQVLLVTDPSFAAGVVSQKNHVHGILKGLGHGSCRVDYIQNEEKVEPGEWFYTSGDDRIFPKGMTVGKVTSAHPGNPFQDVTLDPSGVANGVEEVLIILQGVHQEIPEMKASTAPVYLAPPVGSGETKTGSAAGSTPSLATDADRLHEHYQDIGEVENHKYGDNPPGSKAVDFNLKIKPGDVAAAQAKAAAGKAAGPAAAASAAPQTAKPKASAAAPGVPLVPRVSPPKPKPATADPQQ